MPRRVLDDGIPVRHPVHVRVVGPRPVKGLHSGQEGDLELTDGEAAALVAAGHIALAPPATGHPPEADEPDHAPPPDGRKPTKKPRQRAGLSHAQTTAAAAEEKKE